VTNSNFAALEAKVWQSRRMLTLEDEVGHIRPGYVKPAWVAPPVKFADSRVSVAEQEDEGIDGDPYHWSIHLLAWVAVLAFCGGCIWAVVSTVGRYLAGG
jgi:hypothetical protein